MMLSEGWSVVQVIVAEVVVTALTMSPVISGEPIVVNVLSVVDDDRL
jgi:hypothetical protein